MIDWATPGKASVLVDGGWGSSGKGNISAYLALQHHVDVATTAAGANAGHTSIVNGHKWVCNHLPTTGVVRSVFSGDSCLSYLNAGAIIDIPTLLQEIDAVNLPRGALAIHPNVAVITDEHRRAERESGASTERIASTQHGVGAALAAKIWRKNSPLTECHGLRVEAINLNERLARGQSVVVEIPQGIDLGINSRFAPYTTSRECTVMAGLTDARIHPDFLGPTALVTRAFPIRVGFIYNEFQEVIGHSGSAWPDQVELSWETDFPMVTPERTTVTKRVRRIFSWSAMQYRNALELTRPTVVAVTFLDYLRRREEFEYLMKQMHAIEDQLSLLPRYIYGFGPRVENVYDDLDQAMAWFDGRN